MIVELPDGAPRVSLQYVADDGQRSDVVGHLLAADATRLVVLPEDRPAILLPRSAVLMMKKVRERPAIIASPPDILERALTHTWPGVRQARLGGWVLRGGHGYTSRANSALVGGDPGLPFAAAVELVEDWYGTPAQFQIVLGSRDAEAAARAGLTPVKPTRVLAARVADLPRGDAVLTTSATPDAEWLAIWRGGGTPPGLVAELTAAPALYAQIPGVAVGRVAVWGSWAVISCVEVAPEARGQGFGRALTRALFRAVDATFVALQVEESNLAARSLYADEGFVEHHRCAFFER